MTVLGFDTSMPVTTACVVRDDGQVFQTDPPTVARLLGPPEHSSELLPAVADLLERADVGWRDLDALAVGVGPGTFTGLRIGVATARGLGQALGIELRPVSSLEALAAGLAEHAGRSERAIVPLIDARRQQVFASLYRAGPPLDLDERTVVLDDGGEPIGGDDGVAERVRHVPVDLGQRRAELEAQRRAAEEAHAKSEQAERSRPATETPQPRSTAPEPTAPPPGVPAQPESEWDVVPVFYGTDRDRKEEAKRIVYTGDRGRRLELGRALVTVPRTHQVPNIERPFAIRVPFTNVTIYEQAEDPKQHFTIRELQSLPREQFLALVRERIGGSTGKLPIDTISL